MAPTVILTRPQAQAEAFAKALGDVPVLIAPLVAIQPVPPVEDLVNVAHVIFTSVNGVLHAPALPPGVTAWCVGDQTAAAATSKGFAVQNAKGSSADLIKMIKHAQPNGLILHLRGAHAAGNVVENLTAAGFNCRTLVCYAQQDLSAPQTLRDLLAQPEPVICPVFSTRSARRLMALSPVISPLHLVAISDAVLAAANDFPATYRSVAAQPDKTGMLKAVHDAIAARRLEGRRAAY